MAVQKKTRVKKPFNKKVWLKVSLITLAVIVIIRLILPYVVLHYANKTLSEMKGYYGHIDDIDLAIIRGAYRMDSIYLNKADTVTNKQTPFFGAQHIDLSIEWKALFKGELVGELVFESPTLYFVKDKIEPKALQQDSTGFKKLLDDFMPLRVNRFEIMEGIVGFKDNTSKPPVDISMTNMYVLAQNLRNSYDSLTVLPATIKASADVYDGKLDFNMKLNPLADAPTFDMNVEVKNTNLVKLNDFFQAYAKVDVNKGTFGVYAEVAAKDKNFTGYVKPLIQDLDVLGEEDKGDNILKKIWEGLVGTVGEIFQNQRKDQVATKIPFEGKIDNPDANVWYAVVTVLRNAFIQALSPSIEQEINIASVAKPKEQKKEDNKKSKKEKKKKEREVRRAERKKEGKR